MLTFNEERHEYRWSDQLCTSVTTLVHSYSRPFDSDKHSRRIAEREGRTQEDVLRAWREKNRRSTDMGTAVHEYAEREALRLRERHAVREPAGLDPFYPHMLGVLEFYRDHPEIAYGIIEPEFRACYPEKLIAGTVDLVCQLDGVPSIVDFKTNIEIDVLGGYDCMYAPVNHMPDSNWSHYQLQLSIYARMLRDCYHYDAEQLVLIHVNAKGEYERYQVHEKHDEVEKLLDKGLRG